MGEAYFIICKYYRAPLKTVLFRDGGVSRVLKSSCIRPYTPVFRAWLPCPHKKCRVFRGTLHSISLILGQFPYSYISTWFECLVRFMRWARLGCYPEIGPYGDHCLSPSTHLALSFLKPRNGSWAQKRRVRYWCAW